MATHDVEVRVNLRANQNEKSDQFGRLYPYLDRTSTINQRGLCDRIAKTDTIFGREVIDGVVTIFQKTVFDCLAEGVAVQLNGVGTFYPTLVSRKGGVASCAEAVKLGADDIVTGVHVRFLPDGTKIGSITSKKFKERCSLKLNMLQEIAYKTVEGKEVPQYTYRPIYQVANAKPDPGPEP